MPHLQVGRARPAALFALILAIVGGGCDITVGDGGVSVGVAAGKATDEWTRTYTVAAGGRLEIQNQNGLIEASPAAGNEVEVRAERIVKASSDEAAQELLKSLELREEISPGKVQIVTAMPGRLGNHEVRYHVRVPKGLAVQFDNVNGAVKLEDLAAPVTASTTNGGVVGRGLSSAVKAKTTNGGLQIEMTSVGGDVELETVNGGIRLQLPPGARANLEASVTNGRVSLSDLPFQGEQSRHRMSGTLNGGGPRVVAGTVNGGIRISAGSRSDSH